MTLKQTIFEILKKDKRLWDDNITELNQTKLIDLTENLDKKVIGLLFENNETKNKFFKEINESWFFKNNDFRFFIEENKINNSFTDYKNRIGLSDGNKFLKDTDDIVLNYPFKDCVLEGGQTKDDGEDNYFEYDEELNETGKRKGFKENHYNKKTSKRKEIFF